MRIVCFASSTKKSYPPNQREISNRTMISKQVLYNYLAISIALIINFVYLIQVNGEEISQSEAQQRLLQDIKKQDKCQSVFLGKSYGYDMKEYKVVTKDNYILTLYRLIHPEDIPMGRPQQGMKKPYLLLHGLIGSSSSFLRNAYWKYRPPGKTFQGDRAAEMALKSTLSEDKARCLADKFREAFDGDLSASVETMNFAQKLTKVRPHKDFCSIQDSIDYDQDEIVFGREFKQAYKKYEFKKKDAKKYITNSLAFTMSNFGYDVWLVNLRGNNYSNKHTKMGGPEMPAEYWNFGIQDIIENDLPAIIEEVLKQTRVTEPIGLISYSYSAVHVLGLLTKFPRYVESIQPVVMLAPTLLTAQDDNLSLKYFVKFTTKALIANNGPFPALGRTNNDIIRKLICKMPVASRLCRLLETVLHGKTEAVSGVKKLLIDDRQIGLLKDDVDCGQTSTAILHQIVENLNDFKINVKYIPWTQVRVELMKKTFKKPYLRRSVMLVHSQDDQISTLKEVDKIKTTALKTMTLMDYLIKEPGFDHVDFLFSKKNEYLVNGEVARMVTLYDYLSYIKKANEPMEQLKVSRGITHRR